ncbi:hypothetical protein CAPTEDRAFT_154290 [Capitella teleta]|uniref:RRM domain-containing protein n=1 Tax=Capitella teleta TaxID=283909 RepID=R7VFH1_CAPTE|nr:hypothetical protein CAPTEDRAFT_154290 [Capitella teleta]|eukprot:ELU17364.1 hypothetical protein CAPTEDRAFT_154290 [Capitella teleta]
MSRDHTNRGSRRRRRSPSLVRRPPPVGRNTNKTSEIEERRIVYVGRIPGSYTRRDLRKKFEGFGDITDVSVHFREHGDNYGFVTFLYTCDAFACVEQGTTVPGCEHFDMCFGGRREFCKTNYADLDGNMEMEEEIGGGGARRPRNKAASLDFDDLLKQARKSIRR